MRDDDRMTDEFRRALREALEAEAEGRVDWRVFHHRLGDAVSARLAELGRGAAGGYRATAAAGTAWWEYTARAALAAVPIGLAAAAMLIVFLRSGSPGAADTALVPPPLASTAGNADSARAAFESVLTGAAAPRSVMAALIPAPAVTFLAESAGGPPR